MPLPLTVAVVAPAPPASVTSEAVKLVTGSEKVTENLTGDAEVGSSWSACWLMVAAGATESNERLNCVAGLFPVPRLSCAAPAECLR